MAAFTRLILALCLLIFSGQAFAVTLPITTILDSNGDSLTPGWHNAYTTLSLNCVDENGSPCTSTKFNIGTPDNNSYLYDGVSGLAHLWTFDDLINGWIVKDSVGTANGTTRYATFVQGYYGNAMLFESGDDPRDTDHIGADVKLGSDLDNNIIGIGDISICTWMSLGNIQPNRNPGHKTDLSSLLNGMTGRLISNGVTIFFVTFGEMPDTYKLNETNDDPGAKYPSGSASEIKLNTWQHVCLTRDSNGIANFYVDGKPSGPINQPGGGMPRSAPNPNNPNKYVHIGNQENFDLNKFFDGNLDDFRIYNRILTPADINKIYSFGKNWAAGPSIPLNSDQNFKIEYYGIDAAGNNSPIKTAYYAIDATPPTSSIELTDLNQLSKRVRIACADATSGCKKTFYSIDGGAQQNETPPLEFNLNFSPGSHTIAYFSQDNADNNENPLVLAFDLNVIDTNTADTTPPVITLIGQDVNVEVFSVYVDAGATALDDIDGDLTAFILTVNSVNTNVLGFYTVTYDVNDSSGNPAIQVTRTVNVTDTNTQDIIPPVITVLGPNPSSVAQGTTYVDAGATAADNVDGDITANIVVTNQVNTAVVGEYAVSYDVNDSANNSAHATRTVNVVAAQKTNPLSDFNYSIDKVNSWVALKNTTQPVPGATIVGYLWFNNGMQISNLINYNYPTTQNVDLNICLKTYYAGGASGYVTITCKAFNTGVWGAGVNPQSDFNYTIDKVNGIAVLKNVTQPVQGATITGYLWFNNGMQISNSVDYSYPITQNQDLNICLRTYYMGGASGYVTMACRAFNTGVWSTGTNPQSDFNYSIDKANSRVILTNTTQPVQGATLTGYLWFNNGIQISNLINYNYPTTQNVDLNICLKAYYLGGASGYVTTTCKTFNTGNWP
ncbi:MAG: immunoglobulin-like domain-containing protein [Candidatus Diapherotrites archaeon]